MSIPLDPRLRGGDSSSCFCAKCEETHDWLDGEVYAKHRYCVPLPQVRRFRPGVGKAVVEISVGYRTALYEYAAVYDAYEIVTSAQGENPNFPSEAEWLRANNGDGNASGPGSRGGGRGGEFGAEGEDDAGKRRRVEAAGLAAAQRVLSAKQLKAAVLDGAAGDLQALGERHRLQGASALVGRAEDIFAELLASDLYQQWERSDTERNGMPGGCGDMFMCDFIYALPDALLQQGFVRSCDIDRMAVMSLKRDLEGHMAEDGCVTIGDLPGFLAGAPSDESVNMVYAKWGR